jgi:hypothetical protein
VAGRSESAAVLRIRKQLATWATRDGADPWFMLPVCAAMVADATITLALQGTSYWADPSSVEEGNSTWSLILSLGPLAFALVFCAYCASVAVLLTWLRDWPQKLLGMFLLLSHSYGAASWLHVELSESAYWWGLMILFLVEASAFSYYWRQRRAAR